MSVREEDRQNKNCPSRGLGIAAAAIGVGVGAALYYFFSKRPENPHEEGSTSTWECEPAQTFMADSPEETSQEDVSEDSYTTISENTTSDTSIYESTMQDCDQEPMSIDEDETSSWTTDSYTSSNEFSSDVEETGVENNDSCEDFLGSDWEVTDSSMDVPESFVTLHHHSESPFFHTLTVNLRDRGRGKRKISEEEQLKFLRDQAFRERSWSLEECSICFDVILKDQEVMTLPCTHHFHTACILPWLQEQQTCPNCRKVAE